MLRHEAALAFDKLTRGSSGGQLIPTEVIMSSALLTTFLDNEVFQSTVVIGTNALH